MVARRLVRIVAATASLVALQGCPPPGGGDAGPGDAGPDVGVVGYERIQTIYNRSCASFSSCHNSTGMRGDLDLSEGNSYADSVRVESIQATGMNIIEPGDPERSFLVHKIQNTMSSLPVCAMGRPLMCGTRMPMVGGAPLSDEEIAVFRAWIAQGARGPGGQEPPPPRGDAGAATDAATTD